MDPPVAGDAGAGVVAAAYSRRVAAWAIDVAIVWSGFVIVALAVYASIPEADESGEGTSFVLAFAMLLILPLYSALLHRFWHGQTVGKRVVGIAVTRLDGTRIDLPQSLGRSYLRMALLAGALPWLLDSLWPLWQPRRRSLHDLAAGTIVVRGRSLAHTVAGTSAAQPTGWWSRRGRAAKVGIVAAAWLAGVVGIGEAARRLSPAHESLPRAEDFSGTCPWPEGHNAGARFSFSYGCGDSAYHLKLGALGPYHVTRDYTFGAHAVRFDIDAVVRSGRGTAARVSPPSALLGIACLRSDAHGYAGVIGTNGTDEIARWDGEFAGKSGDARPGAIPGIDGTARADVHRIGILCAAQSDGTAVVGLFVDGRLISAFHDPHGFDSFNAVGVYADTYPGDVVFDNFAAARPSQADVRAVRTRVSAPA
jgi:uncharacterized RDD family membrane protein YckC